MSNKNPRPSITFKLVSAFLWLLFILSITSIIIYYPNAPQWYCNGAFRINGLTLIIWATVTFFTAVVCTFSSKYLIGFHYYNRFIALTIGLLVSVSLLVFADHIVLLLLAWFGMGFFMARLIGIDARWGEAREAARYCQWHFFIGGLFLSAGMLLLSFYANQFTLTGLQQHFGNLPFSILLTAALCIIIAAAIQSAMFPFHRWLLSAMTSPTPASALMHAGFVNGAGILLTLLAPLFFKSDTMTLLIIIGGVTAIVAQFTKLIQVNIKQKLGCSTTAQMAFMIMECGLGFFNAGIVHLILHGCYKAYLFLSSGEEIHHISPVRHPKSRSNYLQAIASIVLGVLGALLFAWTTGKGLKADGGIFLTLIVAITVGQAMDNIIKRPELSNLTKSIVGPVVFFLSIGLYALMYNSTSVFMSGLPMTDHPEPLSVLQIVFGVTFLIGFFIMKSGIYKNFPWLYVRLVNDSQPYKKTVLRYKKYIK
ncbi:MAG: pesticidal protein Cry28Aa [Chitinophagaceae bacterium]|nr:MAG: pesticidal protein Cry28Aa [Chitinophagaceae bacterium]